MSTSDRFDLKLGDCLDVLKTLPDVSIDAVVSDPPYGLSKEPDIAEVMRHWIAGDRYEHKGSGFMGKSWDSFVPGPEYWRECYRVLKPGGHMLIFAGTRTADLMSVAIRFAGFEIRDAIDVFESGDEPLSRFLDSLDDAQRDAFLRVLNQIESPLMRWAYGSGFPKSMAIDKAIDKSTTRDPKSGEFVHRGLFAEMYPVTTEIADLRDLAGVKNGEIDALFGTNGMAGHWTARVTNSQPQVPSLDEWEKIRALLADSYSKRWLDREPEARKADDLTSFDARLDKLDAEVARICGRKGAVGDAWLERPVTGQHDRPAAGQTWRENYTEIDDPHLLAAAQAIHGKERRDEPTTDGARAWQGWGTALKPAQEPIILARKSLAGTVAANVLKYGTGAINIDACRVAVSDEDREAAKNAGGWAKKGYVSPEGATDFLDGVKSKGKPDNMEYHAAGRWPANLMLAHGAACVKVGTKRVKAALPATGPTRPGASESLARGSFMGTGDAAPPNYADADGMEEVENWNCAPGCPVGDLDRQSGQGVSRAATKTVAGPNFKNEVYGRGLGGTMSANNTHSDSGGASRFFYVAKPDSGERDLGLEGMRKVSRAEAVCREDDADKEWVNNPRAGAGSRKGRANIHPTVKPIDLMRWLCRLVTPKEGVVLDPFMGSGTTGVACSREGFRFVGVERDPKYYEIAKARLIGDSPLFNRIQVKAVEPPPDVGAAPGASLALVERAEGAD